MISPPRMNVKDSHPLFYPLKGGTLFLKVNANGQLKGVFVFWLFLFMVFEALNDDPVVFLVEFAIAAILEGSDWSKL